MKKRGLISEILIRTVLVLAGIQVFMGVIWCVGNFGSIQAFPETEELLSVADTLVTDEYVGILYPLLLRVFRSLDALLPFPYYSLLYVLQLGMGFATLGRLLEGCRGRYLIALGILSTPVVLQLCLAVLPQAFALWILLLCVDCCRRKQWVRGSLCWLLGGLLIPEYFLFGGIMYLGEGAFRFARRYGKKRSAERRHNSAKQNQGQELNQNEKPDPDPKDGMGALVGKAGIIRRLQGVICALAVCLIFCGVWNATVEVHSLGRMARTPASMALRRTVWPHFSFTSYFWDQEVKDLFDADELVEISHYPEQVLYLFGPAMEETYGEAKATAIYLRMSATALQIHTRQIVTETCQDLLQSCAPSLALMVNLCGVGVSYSGWNYSYMAAHMPVLTKYYVTYAGCCLLPMLLLAVAAQILERKDSQSVPRGKGSASAFSFRSLLARLLPLAVVQIVFYTLSAAAMQDYKNLMLVSVCWGLSISMFCVRAWEGSRFLK